MKRTLLFDRESAVVAGGVGLIAATYGLVRLAYGLFLPDVQSALSMSSATAGLTSAAASVAYCLGALAALGAARHARLLATGALLTAAIGSLGMALAPTVAVFVPLAVLGSVGAGLASPALVVIVERNVGAPRIDRAQAIVNAGTGPGLVGAGVMALVLLPQWRLGFAVSAALTVLAGLVVLLADRGSRGSAPASAAPTTAPPIRWGWPDVRRLLRPGSAALLLGTASAAVWTYGRSYVIVSGLGETTSTVAWIVLGLGGTAAVLTAGRLARQGPDRAWLLSTAAVAASIVVVTLAPGEVAWALAAFAAFGWGFVAATSALIGWATTLLPGRAGAGTSVLFVTLVLGQAVGSALTAQVATGRGLTAGFAVAAGLGLLAVLCGVPHRTRPDRRATGAARRWRRDARPTMLWAANPPAKETTCAESLPTSGRRSRWRASC